MYITTDDTTEGKKNNDSNKLIFMIGVDAKSQYVMAIRISTVSAKEVVNSLKQIENTYIRNNKTLTEIRMDNDPAHKFDYLDKAFEHKMRIQYCTPGKHVTVAEAAIKVIKSLARTTVTDIATSRRFTKQFVPYLIDWVTESLNFSLRNNNDYLSPYQHFTGYVVNADKHFRVAFLEIVAVQDLTKNVPNLNPRAKVCLVVGREKSFNGGLLVLNTENKQILRRYDFVVLNSEEIYKLIDTRFNGIILNHSIAFADEAETINLSVTDIRLLEDAAKAKIHNVPTTSPSESESSSISSSLIDDPTTTESPVDTISIVQSNSNSESSNISSFLMDDSSMIVPPVVATTISQSKESISNKKGGRIMRLRSAASVITNFLTFAEAETVDIERDGNCLFECVNYYLNNDVNYVIRQEVYNKMQELKHTQIADLTVEEWVALSVEGQNHNFDQYINMQRQDGNWGGEIELRIIATLYNLSIDVYTRAPGRYNFTNTYNPEPSHEAKPQRIRLAFVDTIHYEPLILISKEVKTKSKPIITSVTSSKSAVKKPVNTTAKTSNLESTIEDQQGIREQFEDEFEENMEAEILITDEYAALTYNQMISKVTPPSNKSIEKALRVKYSDEIVDTAIADEIRQMHDKGVWVYVSPQDVRKIRERKHQILPMQLLTKEKKDSNGNFVKIKARMVVLGNLQKDATDTEAPTARLQSFYMFILIAAKLNIPLITDDVNGAFLHASILEIIYVILNKELTAIAIKANPLLKLYLNKDGTLIAQLLKCLYGLKQSPKRWYNTIIDILKKMNFLTSEHDTCVFYKNENGKINLLLLFVDDMLIAFQDSRVLSQFHSALTLAFGELSTQQGEYISFLGISIRQTTDTITLSQSGYILKMIEKINPDVIPVFNNPMSTNFKLCQDRFLKSKEEADPKIAQEMKSLTMTLMYIAMRTRRDVLFHASFFAAINCPTKNDIDAVRRVIIYLYNTIDKVQTFYRKGEIKLILYGDASHNAFINATGQNCEIVYGDEYSAAIEFSSSRESKITSSSYESELIVQNRAVEKGLKAKEFLIELGINIGNEPIKLYSDNEAAVLTSQVPHINKSGRTKYMNRQLFHLNQYVTNGTIEPTWISTDEMDADIGTKPLSGALFHKFAERQFSRNIPK